jgi:hypothetical protein
MRTKSMILGAALLAAGVASSMAQSNVYSVNVVGYINLSLTNGLNLVANQLDFDGTGTNNTIIGVFSNSLPNGSAVYKFSGGTFQSYSFARGSWSGNTTGVSLNPGEACFVSVSAPLTITTVGQVLQGTTTNSLSGALNLVSSTFPLSGAIDSTGNGGLAYTPINGDAVYLWDPVGQGYVGYSRARGAWGPSDPILSPGQGLFLQTTQTSWANSFTVQ